MYTVNNSLFDIWAMLAFGVIGFLIRKWAFEGAPLLLALVLGPRMEVAFRQSLIISHGDFSTFLTRPISLMFIIGTLLFLLFPVFRLIVKKSRRGGASNV